MCYSPVKNIHTTSMTGKRRASVLKHEDGVLCFVVILYHAPMNREFSSRQCEHDTQTHSARRKSINANTAVFIVLATEQGDLHIETE